MSTGKHLHWELRLGNKHIWDANGKHYIEPIGFFKALIAYEASVATAPVVADPKAPVAPAPEHNEIQASAVEAERLAAKTEAVKAKVEPLVKAVAKADAASKKPALTGELKVGSTGPAVKWLQSRLGVAVTGTFDNVTKDAVVKFQKTRKEITKPDGAVGNLTWKALG
jgi:hypothetical protein